VLSHRQARELEMIDRILLANPSLVEAVWKDLQRHVARRALGRPGLSADQTLRAAIVKQMNGFSYEDLAFHLADSLTYRRFCGFTVPEQAPRKSALAGNIKRISPATWEAINRVLVGYAKDQGVELGETLRIDPTVTETNIQAPSDNRLLFDSVRVIGRLLKRARTRFGVAYSSRVKRAKRRHIAIMNARSPGQRRDLYRDLLKITCETIRYAEEAVLSLNEDDCCDEARRLAASLEHYAVLARQVVSQTERRVLHGESVPAAEKLVSIFEPHTDIIRKDRRDTYFGHKVTLSGGRSGLILDWVVEDGNPADSTLLTRMLDRLQGIYGAYPRQVSVDGGFASRENLVSARERGVVDVVFAKKREMRLEEMATSRRVYRRLRDFRAGIEGMISFLKRVFGLSRCTWRSLPSFCSYVGASIVSANLLILARHLMQ